MASKPLTKNEARALAYVYALQSGQLDPVLKANIHIDLAYLFHDYQSPDMAKRTIPLYVRGLLQAKPEMSSRGLHQITGAGIHAIFNDPTVLKARLDLARLHKSYGQRYIKGYDPDPDNERISSLKEALGQTTKPKQRSKTTTTKARTRRTKPKTKTTTPAKPKPLTPKQRSWLSWLFRGDPRVKQ